MEKGKRGTLTWVLGTAALAVLCVSDLLCGGVSIPFSDIVDGLFGKGPYEAVIRSVRLPRILTAILAGACLSLGGAQMQAVFRNPLADPHIMGVSAGAALGAAIATMAGPSVWGIGVALAAALGAVMASALILAVSSRVSSGNTLLVFGVMLGFILSAVTSILQYLSNEESLKLFYSWSAGSFTLSRPGEIAILTGALIVGLILSLWNAKGLDALLFGDEFATLSGADVGKVRFLALVGCCILTGAVTAFCGPLGFVGIVAPHIARVALSSSVHIRVLPASALAGACIALLSDLISQAFRIPLPVGSTMAIVGIPVILLMMTKGKGSSV